jgi:hypothetical protein
MELLDDCIRSASALRRACEEAARVWEAATVRATQAASAAQVVAAAEEAPEPEPGADDPW